MKRSVFHGASAIAVVFAAGLFAQSAFAADAAADADTEGTSVGEVVVTGTLIEGTPENAALPVTVMNAETIQRQGSPTIIELIKQLPESSGIIGESNQFVAGGRGQGQYGQGTINLRGLGPERTLVLFNGHRLPTAFAFAVDTKVLPISAVGRVEVLKDGAAATYGSDAIAGVVNFITKKNVEGLEVGGDYRWIQGSEGDYTLNATWGHSWDTFDFMISGGYQHQGELPIREKSWALRRYDANPEGGWTGGGNPEAFTPAGLIGGGGTQLLPLAGARLDLGCEAVGGQLTTSNANPPPLLPWSSCRAQYTLWDMLEEEVNSYQVYSEANIQLGGSHKLHLEGLYAYTDIPFFKSSPSYVTTRPVSSRVLPANYSPALFVAGTVPLHSFLYFVPISNPGFAAYNAANPGQFPAGTVGAFLTVGTFRPYINGGNPLYDYEHGVGGNYWHEQINLNAEVKGDITEGLHYAASLTWGRYRTYAEGRDSLTDRLELALRGLGGPGCDFTTGTPGVGPCQYYNPFSNAIPGSPPRGLTNPGFVPALENTAEMADWIMPIQTGVSDFQDIEGDFTLSGALPFFSLPGGDISWALGAQWRQNKYKTDYSLYGNALLAPCTDAALPGDGANCPANANPAAGPNVFGPVSNPVNLKQNIYAVFGQVDLPIFDRLFVSLAGRYEDYGEFGGSTFNPQARAKLELTDFFAIRGTVGTTFRAPPQGFLIPDPATNLQQVLGTFIPVSSIGNPLLKPEKATTYTIGAILETGGLHFTADWWSYDFKDLLTVEPLGSVVGALFPNGAALPNNCATLDAGFIADHFEFSGPCGPTTVVRVLLQRINGPTVKTDGLDLNANYRFDDVLNGTLTFGGVATYVHKYHVSPFTLGGVPIAGFEASGFFNSGTIAYPIPKWKGQLYANFELGSFNFRWTARYIHSYRDQRATLFAFNPIYRTPTNPTGIVSNGSVIPSIVLHDVAIRVPLPSFSMAHDVVFTAAIQNIFDKDPPFARTDLNYDALSGDPLGRTIKVGLQAKF